MGKGSKNIAKIAIRAVAVTVSVVLFVAIVLPLAGSLVLSTPRVQTAVVKRVTQMLSKNIGAKISIDRIDLRLVNHAVVDGFLVEDLHGDTLLYVGRLTAPIEKLGIIEGPLTLGKVRLDDTEMWLRRDSLGEMNIRALIQKIRAGKPRNPDPKFRMRIRGIETEGLTFGLLRYDKPLKDKGIDWSRFVIRNTNIDIDDFEIAGDTIRIGIEKLSFDERSGFHLNNLAAHDLIISEGVVALDNVRIDGESGTKLDIPAVHLVAENRLWGSFSHFIDSVSLGVRMTDSKLSTDFLHHFVPAAAPLRLTADNLSLHTSGPVARLRGGIENADVMDSRLALQFTSHGFPDFENARVNADIKLLSTDAYDVDRMSKKLGGRGLPDGVFKILQRLGEVKFTGKAQGGLREISVDGALETGAGNLAVNGTLAGISSGPVVINADVSTGGFNAGKVLAMGDLGSVAGSFTVGAGGARTTVHGNITSLDFHGYDYSAIALEVGLTGEKIEAKITARDPNLDLDLDGNFNLPNKKSTAKPVYDLDLNVRRADLVAMKINRRDSVSVVSGHLVAEIIGGADDPDGLNGSVEMWNASYTGPQGTFSTPPLTLSAKTSPRGKALTLRSEFADATLNTAIAYKDLVGYMTDFLSDYIPSLSKNRAAGERRRVYEAQTTESTLEVRVKNIDRLLTAIAPGTQLAAGTHVSLTFDPARHNFSLAASSEFIEYKTILAGNVALSAGNASDSLTVSLTTGDLYVGKLHVPHFSLAGGAKGILPTGSSAGTTANGTGSAGAGTKTTDAYLDVRLSDPTKNFAARLGARITDNPAGSGLRIRLTPSNVSIDDKRWSLVGRAIDIADGRLKVDGFSIFASDNPSQQISARGTVSKFATDTLHVALRDFDLSPLGKLVKNNKLRLEGRASGYVDAASLTGTPKIGAGLDITGLRVNEMNIAAMRLTSFWDTRAERIRFQMTNMVSVTNVVSGSVSPKTGALDARANIHTLDMSLLDMFLPASVIERTHGKADVDLTVSGTLKDPLVDGQVAIRDFQTTVGFTGVVYRMPRAMVKIVNSVLHLPATAIYDRFFDPAKMAANQPAATSGVGSFEMMIDIKKLSAPQIDITATLQNMLALDTSESANEAFFGHVMASGALAIHSGAMGTRMSILVRTEKGTKFNLPLNGKRNISWSDFVTFRDGSMTGEGVEGRFSVQRRKQLVFNRKQRELNPTQRKKPLSLDLTVNATPDAQIHLLVDPALGGGITARGEGVINLRIDPATDHFSMTGDYSISEGRVEFSMLDVFNKNFTITPGSTLRWSGEPNDAALNISASYRVRAALAPLLGDNEMLDGGGRASVQVDCILGLAGTLSEPVVTFDIKVPTADPNIQVLVENSMNTQELKSMQFIALLTTGSFAADNSIAGQTAGSGIAAGGAVGIDILTHQLSNILSSDDYNIYLRYRPQSDYTGNEVDLGFTTNLVNNRLLLEIEGNYIEDRNANSVGMTNNPTNLAGDVSLTWVITPQGGLRLRVFSQNIDRWNETQGLQESGLGLYWKKDFNRIGDIFRSSRRAERRKNANFERAKADSVRAVRKWQSDSVRLVEKRRSDSARLAMREQKRLARQQKRAAKN